MERSYYKGDIEKVTIVNREGDEQLVDLVSIEGGVYIDDRSSTPFEFLLQEEINEVMPVNNLTKGQTVISFVEGHGFAVGDYWTFYWTSPLIPGREQVNQIEIVGVDTNSITIGTPILENIDLSTIRKSDRVNTNLAVDGSGALRLFTFRPPEGLIWKVNRMILAMVMTGQGDDGKFGSLTKLTKGMFFGVKTDFVDQYLGGFRENSNFRATAYDLEYISRSVPAGSYGMAMRKTFNGKGKFGVPLFLNEKIGAEFAAGVQDDISGLTLFNIRIMGSQE